MSYHSQSLLFVIYVKLLNETDIISLQMFIQADRDGYVLLRFSSQHQYYRQITSLELHQSLSANALKVRGDGNRYLTDDIKADNKTVELNKSICHNDCGRTIDSSADNRCYSCHICRSVHYCSSDCQDQHYQYHEQYCYDLYRGFCYHKVRQIEETSPCSCQGCQLVYDDLIDVNQQPIAITWKQCVKCGTPYCCHLSATALVIS
jgi:hypothetical protein